MIENLQIHTHTHRERDEKKQIKRKPNFFQINSLQHRHNLHASEYSTTTIFASLRKSSGEKHSRKTIRTQLSVVTRKRKLNGKADNKKYSERERKKAENKISLVLK